ncbi:MAG: DUF5706 domain-containing protein, partial [Dehalococcoidales bacterium]|nr:DUF5706 domain-containing protein [Dehalococcoidales bacterium]
MSSEKHAKVLRILDDQNRLVERADTKAISLLSTMGIFSFFFISQFGNIPIDVFSIILLVIYFAGVFTALLHIILAISPRIHPTLMKPANTGTEHTTNQPTFYAGICKFPDAAAYQECLEDLLDDESATTEIYVQQIYEVAKI